MSPAAPPTIILTTLNARYSHTAFGLRYLLANMGELTPHTRLLEFTIHQPPEEIVESLLQQQPTVIGLGVYIWNRLQIEAIVTLLKQVAPQTTVVLGGPEISYEFKQSSLFAQCDHLICGMADLAFARLCDDLLHGRSVSKLINADVPPLDAIQLPYHLYSDRDITQRVIYVEASRGCPFHCEFCLSALDRTAWPFPLAAITSALDKLWQRGARRFKFVDRTFNLNVATTAALLNFFLARLDSDTRLHFELIPDHLPVALRELISRFPEEVLKFEIGIQSFNPEVQARISRRQDHHKSVANLRWLRQQSHAHLHADLIIGLPGETLDSIASSFNQLLALQPQVIQVGLLKRLRGTPLSRHDSEWQMQYQTTPPYRLLASRTLDFFTLQRLSRFARYRDLIANSGHFFYTLPLRDYGSQPAPASPFQRFLALADWLYQETAQTHQINLKRLFGLLHQYLVSINECHETPAPDHPLQQDYRLSKLNGAPPWQSDR
ncbi:MAG: DUF4080 domain-containing protein [Gammaproteobacteria bacterium]|nr:DUF4080 domain-containing protein [Gammaproteobacteria bacterium]